MATSGFEGFEKRLELNFSISDHLGLRRLSFNSIQLVLDAVQCTVVSAIANHHFDAYVLSESSLFVYRDKIIIKTCGTTLLLRSIPCLLDLTADMGLRLRRCRYTRGGFHFPKAQPFPHTSFREEVVFLEEALPAALCYRKACVLPSKTPHSWHVYSASDDHHSVAAAAEMPTKFTVEVCMTQLDRVLAKRFFRRPGDCGSGGDMAGKEMTKLTGIDTINPRAVICDFAFDPCGYSMNGLDGLCYSTIHVTPEDGHSYASFECTGELEGDAGCTDEIERILKKVVGVFRPGTMSVSLWVEQGGGCGGDEGLFSGVGLSRCRGRKVEEFPGGGSIVYQTFVDRRK